MDSLTPSAPPLAPPAPKGPPPRPLLPLPPTIPPPPTSATAVAAAPQVFDYAYFRGLDGTTPINYKIHNVALKWFRDGLERADRDHMTFSNTDSHEVAEIDRQKGGPLYAFNEANMTLWRWQDMVAQLRADDCQKLCQGLCQEDEDPADRSRGLIGCRIQKTEVYDHKRHSALQDTSDPPGDILYVWHFVLECEHGAQVFLHPNYSNPKVECHREALLPDYEIPRSGLGGTSSRGTFKYFKSKYVHDTLRFNAAQANAKPKAKAIV